MNFVTSIGSSLQIIVTNNVIKSNKFSTNTSCTINNIYQICTILTNQTYTTITISSNNSVNLFQQFVPGKVVINNLVFNSCSSYSYRVYHVYFVVSSSSLPNAVTNSTIAVPLVVPERNKLGYFYNYISNNLNYSPILYPNILRLVSLNPT